MPGHKIFLIFFVHRYTLLSCAYWIHLENTHSTSLLIIESKPYPLWMILQEQISTHNSFPQVLKDMCWRTLSPIALHRQAGKTDSELGNCSWAICFLSTYPTQNSMAIPTHFPFRRWIQVLSAIVFRIHWIRKKPGGWKGEKEKGLCFGRDCLVEYG